MNWNQPAPGMVKWHKSRYADFMRKHRWFFWGSPGISPLYTCPYLFVFAYIPAAASVASGNRTLATIIVPLSLIHMVLYAILALAAFSTINHDVNN